MLRERETLSMASRSQACMIRFADFDRHLFNPLHKFLRIITDERSFEKLNNWPRLPYR